MSQLTDALKFFDDDMGVIPGDITLITPDQLRNAHAYWTMSHNFCTSRLADIQGKIKEQKRRREVTYKTLFLENKQRRMNNEVARYTAELDHSVMRIDDRLSKLEQHEIRWYNLQKQCDYLKALCSRDQSYREEELKTYFTRGGAGEVNEGRRR